MLHRAAKRTVDLVVGVPLAVLAVPVVALLALGVAVSLRSWPFFVQERIGTAGRPFRCPKLRTLPSEAPRYGLKNQIRLEDLPVPRLCRVLRRSHLDEVPQLFLVPLGRLSLVGPRPKMPDEFEPAPVAYTRIRTQVRQGCTGLWQIGSHTFALPHESPQYDLFYLRYGGIRLDLWILGRTALTMVGMGRSITLDEVPAWARGRGWVEPDAVDDAETDLGVPVPAPLEPVGSLRT